MTAVDADGLEWSTNVQLSVAKACYKRHEQAGVKITFHTFPLNNKDMRQMDTSESTQACLALRDCALHLITKLGFHYVLLGHLQSDFLESRF